MPTQTVLRQTFSGKCICADGLILGARFGSIQLDAYLQHRQYQDALTFLSLSIGTLPRLNVPQEAVGFVTGRGGNFLRSIEEEWPGPYLFPLFVRLFIIVTGCLRCAMLINLCALGGTHSHCDHLANTMHVSSTLKHAIAC